MNIGYIVKLWASVIVVAPLLILISVLMDGGGSILDSTVLETYVYAVLLGAVYSAPFLIVLLILSLIIDDNIKEPLTIKVLYIVGSLLGMSATIYIMLGGDLSIRDYGGGSIIMYYGICIFLFGMIYKVKAAPTVSKEDSNA